MSAMKDIVCPHVQCTQLHMLLFQYVHVHCVAMPVAKVLIYIAHIWGSFTLIAAIIGPIDLSHCATSGFVRLVWAVHSVACME